MRRSVFAVCVCIAAMVAVAGPAVQATAQSGRAGSHVSADGQAAGPASRRDQTGLITGVLLGPYGRPVPGACVTATLEAGRAAKASWAGTAGTVMARTSAGGRYFFGGLTAGRYLLRYHACAHAAGRVGASGQAIVTAGQLVRVAPVTLRDPLLPGSGPAATRPEIPAHAGITLPARARLTPADLRQREARSGYGGISGRVTDAAGRPIKGICVMAHVRRGSGFIGISTSAQGTYRFEKYLRAGRYTLQFGSCDSGESAGNWAPQWFRGKYRQARADLVRVRAGKVTRQINAVMRRGGSISGVVTGQRGTRLSRVCVTAVTADRKQFVAQAKTVRGRYRIKALDAGRYRVYFDPACGYHATRYLDQWWPAASTVKASKPVTVRLGAVTRRVNAALRLGGTIAGTVRFENSQGRPLAGICVFGLGLGPVSSVEQDGVTKKNGTFVLQGLPGGRYKLEFGAVGCGNNGNYLYYSDPHPVQVGLGKVAHVVVFMKPGAIISGTVTSAATGRPLAGICVFTSAFDGGVTSADGRFRFDQIQPGRYSVVFYGGCGNEGSYAPQWFRGRAKAFNAARVTLRGGKLTSGIDAAMRPGSGISGVVTSKAGLSLGRICIGAYTPNEATYLFGVFGDFYNGQTRHGVYQISNLAAGQYQIVFFSCGSGPGWASRWYRSAATLRGAGLLDVPAATTVTGVNATLTRGGAISGKVRAPTGRPFSFTCIIATNLATGASESTEAGSFPSGLAVGYGIGGLAPGRYRVEFEDCGGGSPTQWYSRKSRPAAADPVTVRARHVTRHIDAFLVRPGAGSISGRVASRATGMPVSGICVTAFSSAVFRSDRSDARGHYAIRHLATGSYRLYFASCRGDRYAAQVRPGRIRVHAPRAVRGANFAVELAGTISGAVTGGSPSPAPRQGVCVTALPLARSGQPGYAVTGRGGAYAVRGLVPGRYQVHFDPVGCVYGALPFAPEWYGGASRSSATPVTVSAGAATAGVDVVLARDGTITGTIVGPAPASAPLTGICVRATPTGALARARNHVYTVSQSGSYKLTALPAGQYLVNFTSGCGASGYAAQWWQHANSPATAVPVTVAPGSVTKGIDATMHS
jgi:protocatechuate 3,4-dioxygenase beta subunit